MTVNQYSVSINDNGYTLIYGRRRNDWRKFSLCVHTNCHWMVQGTITIRKAMKTYNGNNSQMPIPLALLILAFNFKAHLKSDSRNDSIELRNHRFVLILCHVELWHVMHSKTAYLHSRLHRSINSKKMASASYQHYMYPFQSTNLLLEMVQMKQNMREYVLKSSKNKQGQLCELSSRKLEFCIAFFRNICCIV